MLEVILEEKEAALPRFVRSETPKSIVRGPYPSYRVRNGPLFSFGKSGQHRGDSKQAKKRRACLFALLLLLIGIPLCCSRTLSYRSISLLESLVWNEDPFDGYHGNEILATSCHTLPKFLR